MVLGKHQDARENKTNCFPRDLTLNSINKKLGKLQKIWAVVWGDAFSILILVSPADLNVRVLSDEIKSQVVKCFWWRFLTGWFCKCVVSTPGFFSLVKKNSSFQYYQLSQFYFLFITKGGSAPKRSKSAPRSKARNAKQSKATPSTSTNGIISLIIYHFKLSLWRLNGFISKGYHSGPSFTFRFHQERIWSCNNIAT